MTADLTVAPRVQIGQIAYTNVVFLVLPDSTLTFSNGFRIPRIMGFPLIEGMGEVHFRRDGSLQIPATPSRSGPRNLAMEELRPLVQVTYDGERLACLLDSGAGESQLAAPYDFTHRARVDRAGARDSIKLGGAGGVTRERVLPIYRLSRSHLRLVTRLSCSGPCVCRLLVWMIQRMNSSARLDWMCFAHRTSTR